MAWLSIFSGLLKLTSILSRMIERRGLMQQGEVRAAYRSSQETLGNVERAMDARRAVKHDARSVRNDPNRRK
jgi:hypothetical protein